MSRQGVSTRYIRTSGMNTARQVSVQEMSDRLHGPALSHADLLALCPTLGVDDARVELGQVVAAHQNPRWGVVVLQSRRDVERLAAARAARGV